MNTDNQLNFSLPPEKNKTGAGQKVIVLLLMILIGLAGLNLFMSKAPSVAKAPVVKSVSNLSAEQTKSLAVKLSQRNLYDQAALVWQEYIQQATIVDTERANALFQIGTLLEKAEQYDEAVAYFYRSELCEEVDDLKSLINSHLKTCFEKLGRFSALRYELMDRTSYKGKDDASGTVVAEIGPEKITEADLSSFVEKSIESQLAPMATFMTPEDLAGQKKRMLEQFKDKQAKQRFLQTYLTQEILYRQALEENLLDDTDVKKQLNELTQNVLAQQQISRQLASKINITQGDLQTYYNANKTQYLEAEKAYINHILVADEAKAKALLKKIQDGADLGSLAKTESLDEGTKENGGQISTPVTSGSYVPGIGENEALNQAIFGAVAPTVLEQPYETDKGWAVIGVTGKEPARQRSFDEVSQEIMRTLSTQKSQEVQQQYIQQMMDKFNVIIHTTHFQSDKAAVPE